MNIQEFLTRLPTTTDSLALAAFTTAVMAFMYTGLTGYPAFRLALTKNRAAIFGLTGTVLSFYLYFATIALLNGGFANGQNILGAVTFVLLQTAVFFLLQHLIGGGLVARLQANSLATAGMLTTAQTAASTLSLVAVALAAR